MSDVTADLMSALEGEEVSAPIPDPDQATPDVVSEWVAQVNRLNAQEAEYQAAYKAAVAKLAERRDQRLGALAQQREWLEDAIETYHRARLAKDPEARTIHVPTGKVSSRAGRDTFEITDEDAFGAWAVVEFPEAIEFPEPKLKRREARKLLKAGTISDGKLMIDGIPVPGVHAEKAKDEDRTFTVGE